MTFPFTPFRERRKQRMQDFLIKLVISALPKLLCQIFGYCVDQEECPDGVCDEVFKALDSFDTETPTPSMDPSKVQAASFNINWDELECLTQSTVEFIKCLKAFLGITPKVG